MNFLDIAVAKSLAKSDGSSGSIDLSSYYQKPSSGIPASDLAEDVMPDVSGFATKENPVFSGTLSMNRKNNAIGYYNSTTLGYDNQATNWEALAEGRDNVASGRRSHAEGISTTASEDCAHSEGSNTVASGQYTHAEGWLTQASNIAAHSEGHYSKAMGEDSHAEGANVEARDSSTHAQGCYTIAASNVNTALGRYNVISPSYPAWEANKSYTVGDLVTVDNETYTVAYKCAVDNNDAEFTDGHWITLIHSGPQAVVVGNGSFYDGRSNAAMLDWDGNLKISGDMYVDANTDSSGGNRVATESYVNARIPTPPDTDGSYVLQLTVSSGTYIYAWVEI